MKEVILCKYGEIALKGANRGSFEALLLRELRYRISEFGKFKVEASQSTVTVSPMNDNCDIEAAFSVVLRTFGIIAAVRAAVCEKSMEAISECASAYLPQFLAGKKTFKVESKRSDKTFPLKSPEISAEIGGVVLDTCPFLRVDVNNPEAVVRVEIRDHTAYVHAGQTHGAGGIPVGSSGRGLLLLSGGIDSPVAGYMMAKRGMKIEALHFESFPYTSEKAKEKVLSLAKLLTAYCGSMDVHVVSLTHIQEELRRTTDEEYFTLLLRRAMMTIADRIAAQHGCETLITGESLGQVASQTMQSIAVTDCMTALPVFRPCIGLDKEEIIETARKIGTFDTSVLPYEDCCTVFTPRHPKTRPEPEKVAAEEAKYAFDTLISEALSGAETITVKMR